MLPLLRFSPVLHPKPWGGDALWRMLGKGKSTDERMGESWELSDRPEGLTPVAEGPWAGKTLPDILAAHAADVLGDLLRDLPPAPAATPGAAPAAAPNLPAVSFPLLYKFIAAREKLSVQVHPGAHSPLGEAKTECWYVVDAAPDASLIIGVSPGGRSPDVVLETLASPACGKILQRLPARAGDTFFIPAGTVHAITEGLLLYELQQNSDTTFRLYDWGRVDAAGRPRALHVAEAAQVADTQRREGYHIPPLRVRHASHAEDFLVACKYFALTKLSGFKGPASLVDRGRFQVVSLVAGSATLRAADGQTVSLKRGDTVLVPACQRGVALDASADAEALVSFVPDLERDIRGVLSATGFSPAEIDALSGPAGVPV